MAEDEVPDRFKDIIGEGGQLRVPADAVAGLEAARWLANQLTEPAPDYWSLSGLWREGEATVYQLTYNKRGPHERVIEVEGRDGTWHVISDSARPGAG